MTALGSVICDFGSFRLCHWTASHITRCAGPQAISMAISICLCTVAHFWEGNDSMLSANHFNEP